MKSKFPMLSVCMIVKNEGHQLADALVNFNQFSDEIIVVDTGSSDDTCEVASQYTDRLFDFPWCNDFAAARNYSVEQARGQYVLWMDADDRVEPDMVQRIVELKADFDGKKAFYFVLQDMNSNGPSASLYQLRCAPNLKSVRFEGRIHERLTIEGLEPRTTEVVVRHFGYIDPEIKRAKAERNLAMLERELRSGNGDAYVNYYLSLTYEGLNRHGEALRHMLEALEHADRQAALSQTPAEKQLNFRYLVEIHFHLARLYHKARQDKSAVQHLLAAQTLGGSDARFLFRLGLTYQELGRPSQALECFRGAMSGEGNTDLFPSVPLPPREQLLLHTVLSHLCLKDHSSAMACLQQAWMLGLPPLQGWESLGFMALKAEEWSIALHAYENATLAGKMSDASYFFLGTLYKQRKLFQKAIHCYEKVLELNPDHPKARAALRELNTNGGNRSCSSGHINPMIGYGVNTRGDLLVVKDSSMRHRDSNLI
jgi:glycosyltransferase involved in cell wall biosynthesis